LRDKQRAYNNDIKFIRVFEEKKNRNKINLPFKGIGKTKLLVMIGCGITSAKDLLECDFDSDEANPKVKETWKDIVECHHEKLKFETDVLESDVAAMEREADIHDLLEGAGIDSEDDEPAVAPKSKASEKLDPFSGMMDTAHCNSRCTSKATIDRIIAADHQNRKKIQDAKMRNIPAMCLKIDFHCKLPDKTKAFAGKGKSFSPFKCGVAIQNEDSMTIFWKFLTCAESIEAIQPDLLRLKERQTHIQTEPSKVSWADNCCTVRLKLQEIFPGTLVKLDCFHWFLRFDDILMDKTSEEANFFRHLMRRAAFVVEDAECARVRHMKPGISNQETHKHTKATIPPPETLSR